MLVDDLQARVDSIEFVDSGECILDFFLGIPTLLVGEKNYGLTNAFEKLLRLIEIPYKYIDRLLMAGQYKLAQDNVNFWLSNKSFKLLLEDSIITDIFEQDRIYISSLRVNDLIIDTLQDPEIVYYEHQQDLTHALYCSNEKLGDWKIGVRLLYSDSFNFVPRIEGVCYKDGSFLVAPTKARKLRMADTTESQVLNQIQEFSYLAQEYARALAVQADDCLQIVDLKDWLNRLKDTVKLTKPQLDYLITELHQAPLLQFILELNKLAFQFDPEQCRDIQAAASNYIATGNFK